MPLRWPEIVKDPQYKAHWNRSFWCSFWHGTILSIWRMTTAHPGFENYVYCPAHKAWWVVKSSKATKWREDYET